VNTRQEQVSGKARAETLGRVFWEVWPDTADPASRYWQEYRRCMRDRVPVAFTERYAPLDIWTEVTAYPSPDGGIAVFFRDVTGQKLAEEAQRRQRWELDQLFANTPDLVCVAGFDRRFRRVNVAFTVALGFSEDELLARPFIEIVHPDDRASVEAELARLARGERTRHFEIRCLHRDGGHRWISWNASPDADRHLLFAAGRDVTEEKARAAFERDLVAIVSHDLRNPLSAVLVSSDALLRRNLDERTRKTAERIHAAADRSLRLVSDLLDFTRARVGSGIPVEPRDVDAGALARRVVDEVSATFPDREIRVESSGAVEGRWDPDRLAQMLANLLVNAVTYGPPEDPVAVRVRGDGEWVLLEVHNGGVPIPAEEIPHIFEPYRRGTQERGAPGSLGLGLFIAHEIARAHGGSISVRSSSEEGTTFSVRIPAAPSRLGVEATSPAGGAR
jgi:PAS domain S-box-containing protein